MPALTCYTPPDARVRPKTRVMAMLPELVSHAEIVRKSAPLSGCCGVYFLIRGGVVVYVGQSTNVFARVAEHSKLREFTDWSWIECHQHQLDVLESTYIHWLQPVENGRVKHRTWIKEECCAPLREHEVEHLVRGLAPPPKKRRKVY